MVKWITIVLALAGVAVGFYTIATAGRDQPPKPPPAAPPSVNPFGRGIAAAGSIEAASRNLPLGAAESGLVAEVLVEVGEKVTAGQALARLDGRALEAELTRANAARVVAEAELARLSAEPRAESLPPLRAAVELARVRLADAREQLEDAADAKRQGAGSPTETARRKFAVQAAEQQLAEAEATLALAEKGTWEPILGVARARLAAAEADIRSIKERMDRLTIRAPIDGTVLKRNIEPGQFATVGMMGSGGMMGTTTAAIVIGDLAKLRVRARVDEEDVPLLREGARGVARVRGAAPEDLPLVMVRVEPLAEPKMSLMGNTTERVDTRVVEVLFDVAGPSRARLFPGQAVDVFIEVTSAP
jgi:multidrug efflux pump subunit AcrA (membrane-fusion protein)